MAALSVSRLAVAVYHTSVVRVRAFVSNSGPHRQQVRGDAQGPARSGLWPLPSSHAMARPLILQIPGQSNGEIDANAQQRV